MKNFFFILLFSMTALITSAQKNNYQLSSHILDVAQGKPAVGVPIKLEKHNEQNGSWALVDKKTTDKNGRVSDFLSSEKTNIGIYKLTFYTSEYFKKGGTESFYPFVEVVFQIKDSSHYHVPITLSAYGYSTYRGN